MAMGQAAYENGSNGTNPTTEDEDIIEGEFEA